MAHLRSTVGIALFGLAIAAGGLVPLVTLDAKQIGNWFSWCAVAIFAGLAIFLGAFARLAILLSPAGRLRKTIRGGVVGGLGIGAGVGGDGGGADGGAGGA